MEELRLQGAADTLVVLALGGDRQPMRGGVLHLEGSLQAVVIAQDICRCCWVGPIGVVFWERSVEDEGGQGAELCVHVGTFPINGKHQGFQVRPHLATVGC